MALFFMRLRDNDQISLKKPLLSASVAFNLKYAMKFLLLLGSLYLGTLSFACGNEYGHNLEGSRVYTEFFYLSDHHRSFDKEAIQRALDNAITKRGQTEDDFKNESNIALYYMKLGEVKKALQILEPLAKEYPGEYTILANLGTAYELDGQLNKALQHIKKGYEINPDSHLGSEWIHIKILEAKIRAKSNPSSLLDQPIVTLADLEAHEADLETRHVNRRVMGEALSNQMALQIRTRVPFTPAPNKVITNLLKTYAQYAEKYETYENALMAQIYRLEFEGSEMRRITIKRDIDALVKKIRTSPGTRLSPMFVDLIRSGDIDPTLMIYAADTIEFQLQAADMQRNAKLDSFDLLKQRVDSLEASKKGRKRGVRIQATSDNGFFWGMLFGTIGLILGIVISTISSRRKR